MILIASAAYVNPEFQIEFGPLPPALLPVGNKRLVEHQVKVLKNQFPLERIVLSLPSTFSLNPKDKIFFARENVQIHYSDDNLSLSASIESAVKNISKCDGILRLLHGDTLLKKPPVGLDIISVVETKSEYPWEVEHTDLEYESVWCGFFSFSNIAELRVALEKSPNDFPQAVKLYDQKYPMARVKTDEWHDFGHVNTYFHSRSCITTERSFNKLEISGGCVRKSGIPNEKIQAESFWFKNLPQELRLFVPQLIGYSEEQADAPYYILEYLPLPPLNEVYVHGKNAVFYWSKVFDLCSEFLQRCKETSMPNENMAQIKSDCIFLVQDKTWERLDQYFKKTNNPGLDTPLRINGVNIPNLRTIVNDCISKHNEARPVIGVMHGDFCLSNILFDSRSDRIKVIDPRGMNYYSVPSIVGDLRYDLAKLTHSIIGLYDFIISDAFDLECNYSDKLCSYELNIYFDQRIELIQDVFYRKNYIDTLKIKDVMPLTVLLFLSMLPLHNENIERQNAMLANALRLYSKYLLV